MSVQLESVIWISLMHEMGTVILMYSAWASYLNGAQQKSGHFAQLQLLDDPEGE
jgi:hypothetical protein